MPLPAIGYLTSGKYSGSFKTKFLEGLAQSGGHWQGDPALPNQTVEIRPGEADGSYDSKDANQTLNKAAAKLNRDRDVKMIVAVGGLVSAFAAVRRSDKPYLVLIGQIPDVDDFELPDRNEIPLLYCGGINLDTTSANIQRNAAAVAKVGGGCTPKEVCLVINENARMAKAERHAWRTQGWKAIAGGADADGDNDKDDFKRVLRKAKNKLNAKAVVISSDPYFALERNDLVSAANLPALNMVVCYPSKYFGGASPAGPTAGRDIWYGPDLDDAYKSLGIKAGNLLTILNGGNPAQFMGLDTAPMLNGNF